MDRLYANLGLPTVISWLGLKPAPDADAIYLQRSLRQIEAAMPTFNLDPSTAHLAAEIAAFEENLPAAQRVALTVLLASSIVALNEGSTRLPVIGPQAHELLARIIGAFFDDADERDGTARVAEISQTIAIMLDSGAAASVIGRTPDDYRPLLYLPPYLYQQRIRAAELHLADDLRPRFEPTVPLASDGEILAALADLSGRPRWLGAEKLTLDEAQSEALRSAATRRLSLITGGPGTGKTSIVLAILRLLVRLGLKPNQIALAAPTGKAAHRMGESIRAGLSQLRDPAAADVELITARLEPATVHRLLGYSPRRETYLHHRNNPLPAAFAIVDESSMLDLNLMHRLVAALRPDAHLVLLGDADQLPSVAAGAVFRDLVAAVHETNAPRQFNAGISTRLPQSYRMNPDEVAGSAILNFAQGINAGAIVAGDNLPLIQERANSAELIFAGVELLDPRRPAIPASPAIDDFLDRWYADLVGGREVNPLVTKAYAYGENGFDVRAMTELQSAYSHLAASRILCVTRVMATGADRINQAMHRLALAAAQRPYDRSRFLAGEPVMIVRNDYDRELFNGDQGMIVRVNRPDSTGSSPMAVFARDDRFEAFHLAALGDAIELCYATTIHKAQGSEFDCAAVVLPDRDLPLLTRELLYTAVSRARKSVVLVGNIDMIQVAAARQATRYSGLADLLSPSHGRVQL